MGIFGNLFDFNHDGRMDALEQGTELGFIMQMMYAQKNLKRPPKKQVKSYLTSLNSAKKYSRKVRRFSFL